MDKNFIPVYQTNLMGNEKLYVNECLDTTWISSKGKFVSQFEQAFAKYIDIPYATTVANGTVALHLALAALGIGPGDEVIVPTLTYIASVNAIKYVGATPVFVDSLNDTWQMDPHDVLEKITPNTKALMIVHLYGHPCDMGRLMSIAKKNNLFIIEDCAEAFGSYYLNQHVGTFGDIATFSFYGNKTITTGEGGMVVTADKILYEKCCNLKSQGVADYRQYWHDRIGFNFRMTNICAAIGLAQLERANDFLTKKRSIANLYREELLDLPVTFHKESPEVKHSYWMCSILVELGLRDKLREYLISQQIETRPLFYPVHIMEIYEEKPELHPISIDLGARGINLPSWPGLTMEQIKYICNSIHSFYKIAKSY